MEYDLVIIGFGISGMVTARHAQKNNLKFIVLEKGDTFGGVWANTYDTTKLQTHKSFYQFSELEAENSMPDYPYKHNLLEYFNSYIEKFNLDTNVKYSSKVIKTEYCKIHKYWKVKTSNKTYKAKYIAFCSGYFCNNNVIPNISVKNKEKVNRTLIVGNGASALDYLEHLKGKSGFENTEYHMIYKRDKYYPNFVTRQLPILLALNPVSLKIFEKMPLLLFKYLFSIFFTFNGRYPDEKINYTNIIRNDIHYILENYKKLKIFKKTITKVEENKVFFSDGSSEYYDEIINKAGYQRKIDIISPPIDDINTVLGYNFTIPRDSELYPQCALIGFAPSYNWIMVSEAQAKWFTESIKNNTFQTKHQEQTFIEKHSKKISGKSFNDLTYKSFKFAEELGIFNETTKNIRNTTLIITLIFAMGILLCTLHNYPILLTGAFSIVLYLYYKYLDESKEEKTKILKVALVFLMYGTFSESFSIKTSGVLKYAEKVKVIIPFLNVRPNCPTFLPLIYLFWAFIVIHLYKIIN
jgi:hypothetical protein